ncbi:MAG: TIGR00296 family protein [Methanosarcinales archaeon]|nr:TIGR00296 family protein [ANME-2 cluster archaeon]MDF1531738.1 TIGR00296 family protein [ANME-2 cluster archaeon]MDW7776638.1 TIGR00296 family protein [Methanosarcinales archaeon]
MTELLTRDEGTIALDIARRAIHEYLASGKTITANGLPSVFHENRGVFVTLNNRYDTGKELRGCIGRPYPVMLLSDAIIISAINAATEDPRFNPVTLRELETIEIEVTVLTMPVRLEGKKSELPGKIEIGRDGLIVQRGGYSGLLLPQVAVEHGFDEEEFLGQTCMKAGLFPDAWLETDTEVFAFEGQIFQEG